MTAVLTPACLVDAEPIDLDRIDLDDIPADLVVSCLVSRCANREAAGEMTSAWPCGDPVAEGRACTGCALDHPATCDTCQRDPRCAPSHL